MFAIPNPALFPSLLLAFVPNVRAPRQNRTRTDSTGTQETQFGFHMSNISYCCTNGSPRDCSRVRKYRNCHENPYMK